MTLLSLIVALLIEQLHPLPVERVMLNPLRRLSDFLVDRFNDGRASNGRVAWWVVVLTFTLSGAFVFFLLWQVHPLLAGVFNVLVLYLTMGFRWESHYFGDIQLALRMGELDRARALLGEWRGRSHEQASHNSMPATSSITIRPGSFLPSARSTREAAQMPAEITTTSVIANDTRVNGTSHRTTAV